MITRSLCLVAAAGVAAVAAVHTVDSMEELGGEGNEFLTCRDEPATACGAAWAEAKAAGPTNAFHSADRLVKAAIAVATDEDCQRATIDASGRGSDWISEAADLFRKCHMIVLRGAMDKAYMREYKRAMDAYVAALRAETLNGTTSHGERYFLKEIGEGRWLVLLPEAFGTPEVIAPFWIRRLLSHPRLLGDNFKLNDLGAAIAEPGAEAQAFHLDDEYILGKHSLAMNGIAGHDLPPTAITVLHPVSPEAITAAHGPTEFCLGSSALLGFDFPNADEAVEDPALLAEVRRLYTHGKRGKRPRCLRTDPATGDDGQTGAFGSLRSDELELGDVVLFDYQIIHRGGANKSPDLRALLYATYSRHWYGDSNFKSPYHADAVDFVAGGGWNGLTKNGKADFARIVKASRFALPDAAVPLGEACPALGDHDTSEGPLFPFDPSETYMTPDSAELSAERDNGGESLYYTV